MAMIIIVGSIGLICLAHFFGKKSELTLSLFAIVITLGALEIIFSQFHPQIMEHNQMFEYDSSLGWKFKANKKGHIIYPGEANHFIKTNAMGFRDHLMLPKRPGDKKILVLGDSFVSNIAVKDDEVFTEILEEELQNTEVLNFGVNGYGQVQEYLQLQKWCNQINPDAIILMIYLRNDFRDNLGGDWLYPRPYVSFDEEKLSFKINQTPQLKTNEEDLNSFSKIYRKSHLFFFIKRKIEFLKVKYSSPDELKNNSSSYLPPELYLCDLQPSEKTQLMYQAMEYLLLKFQAYSDEMEIPMIFVLAPSSVQVDDSLWSSLMELSDIQSDKYLRTLPNSRLSQFAQENSLNMLDLYPSLYAEMKEGVLLYNPREQHWNDKGNRVVAKTLYKYLKSVPMPE